MSGITDPAQEFFKDGLWAWVTDKWKKLIGDAAGHLQVDVVESGLPTGAATSANQTTMITALQLIDDLRGALNSIHTDELDVVIDGQSADVEIKQQTAADLTPGIKGWDGSAWRKLPLMWGYSERWIEEVSDAASGGGDAAAKTAAVSSGYVNVIQAIAAFHDAGANKPLGVYLLSGGVTIFLSQNAAAVSGTRHFWSGEAVLAEGDQVVCSATAPGDGKSAWIEVWGYKMKVAE